MVLYLNILEYWKHLSLVGLTTLPSSNQFRKVSRFEIEQTCTLCIPVNSTKIGGLQSFEQSYGSYH